MGTTTSRYTAKNDDGTSPSKKQHRFAASNSRRRREASKTTSSSTAATKAVTKAKKMTKNSSPALKDSTTQQATLLSGGAGDVATTQQNGRIPLESVARSNDAAEGESAKEKSSSRGDGVENEVNKTPIDPPGALWSQQPAFQPVWGPPAPSVGGNGRSSWAMAMPPFLAPIAATVRHPFSHFSGPNGHGHFPYWQQQQQHYHDCEERSDDNGTPMEAEMEAKTKAGSVDTTMKEEVVTLPSTFAPQEYVDRIRAKAKVNAGQEVNVVQTRSMTAKSRGSTKKVSPTVTVAAHQASSPPSSSKNKGKNLLTKKKTTKMIGDDINDMNSTPEVMTILGKRVTMIDPDRKVFVIDLLSPETCDEIRMMADNHTRTVKEGAETWRTLYTYTKMDLPVVEVDGMVSKYTDKILHDVKKIVGVVFGMRREAMRLRPRSWKERECRSFFSLFSFFCAVYSSPRCSSTHNTFFPLQHTFYSIKHWMKGLTTRVSRCITMAVM